MYKVKEIYYTLQGEGNHAGRPSVFCRFAGCNLWSGREEDRPQAVCRFCDTDFRGTDGVNGGSYEADALADFILSLWPAQSSERPYVVFTGGEPALQLDEELMDSCKKAGITTAIETNGTIALPNGLDWVCVSPKADTNIVVTHGNELKLVFPQPHNSPEQYEHLDFEHFYLQPLDDKDRDKNTEETVAYCLKHPRWKLSLQTHKYLGID